MIISNNNFISIFKEWAEAKEPLINDFGYGPLSDWGNSRQLRYPCMWVTHQPTSTVSVQNRTMVPSNNFTIIFVDKINQQDNTQNENGNDSDNRIHIMSDTQQLAYDFINDTILTFSKFKIIADSNITLSPIEDETTDKVNGWALDISFKTPYINCDIPSITPNNCDPGRVINSDNSFNILVPGGETIDLQDIKVTINGGQELFKPSNQDLDFSNYYFINSNTSTKYPAPLPLTSQDQVGWFDLNNDTDPQVIYGNGIITKNGDNTINNGAGKFLINIFEDFELNFTLSQRGCGMGFTYYNGIKYGPLNSLIDYSLYKGISTGTINVGIRDSTVFTYNITPGETNCKIKRNGFQIEFYVENVLIYTAYAIPSTNIFSQGYVYGQAAIRLNGQYVKNISFTGDFNLPNPNLLEWQMTFYNTNDINVIEATSDNIGTFTLDEKDNVGDITISTDNVTYNTLTFPFTPTDGNTYYFKRDLTTSTGKYKLIGEQ